MTKILPPAHCTFEPDDWMRLARHWHPVARSVDVTTSPYKTVLLDEQLVVYRTGEEVVVAKDICPHRGFLLAWVLPTKVALFAPTTA